MTKTSIDENGQLVYNFGGEDFRIIGATDQTHPGYTNQETGVVWRMREIRRTETNSRIATCNCSNMGPFANDQVAGVAFKLCLRCGRIIA